MFDDIIEQQELEASQTEEQGFDQEPQEEVQQPKKTDPQSSFRALREKSERAERERDEALYRLQQMEAKNNHNHDHESEDDDEDFNLAPDDIAEGKHLSKFNNKIKRLESQLNQYKQQNSAQTTENKLKAQYPDFDKVVSKDNIELLRQQYPEIASTLHNSKDLYATAVSAYTLIKRFGIHQEDEFIADKAQAQRNAIKPKPLQSVNPQQGDSPLSRANAFANGLTDELKEQLRKEMYAARKAI